MVTFADIYNHECLRAIEFGVESIFTRLESCRQENHRNIPCDVEICLTLAEQVCGMAQDSEPVLMYYLASMSSQSIFWLDKVHVDYLAETERAVVSEEHLGELQ